MQAVLAARRVVDGGRRVLEADVNHLYGGRLCVHLAQALLEALVDAAGGSAIPSLCTVRQANTQERLDGAQRRQARGHVDARLVPFIDVVEAVAEEGRGAGGGDHLRAPVPVDARLVRLPIFTPSF